MLKIMFFIFCIINANDTNSVCTRRDKYVGQKITLMTDKTAYGQGDVITIYGKVEKVIIGLEISLQIFFEKNQIGISQIKISQDGEFTDTITAGGPLWKNEGQITIKATYGDSSTERIY